MRTLDAMESRDGLRNVILSDGCVGRHSDSEYSGDSPTHRNSSLMTRNSESCSSTTDVCEDGDDAGAAVQQRPSWGRQVEFILSSLSYAVGLGNIWRFPYLCYRNGGGAFLIPYCLMLLTCGLPLMFFELSLGQFGREGPITVWKICPLFKGIGYAMFMISFYIGCYYNVIIAWAIYYIYSSFTSVLPWTNCGNDWNTKLCKNVDSQECNLNGGLMMLNGTCFYMNSTSPEQWKLVEQSVLAHKSPADEFFHEHVLDISEGFHDIGGFQLQIVCALAVAWAVVYLVLIKGVNSFGKAVYFTATFPYVILTVLLIKAATLPGYSDGIYFYLTPQWDKLATISSLSLAEVSPRSGEMNSRVAEEESRGWLVLIEVPGTRDEEATRPGLAFVAYPEAVARLPVSPAWSILFFAMLLTLGLGTQFTILTTIITTITDDFPSLRGKNYKWGLLAACLVMFSVGLSMTTKAGMYVLNMMDSYSSTFSALMVGVIEVLVVTWIYGVDNFMDDIKLMLGKHPYPRWFWRNIWKFGMPLMVFTILAGTFLFYEAPSYGDYHFPRWANIVGWALSFSSVALIPVVALYQVCRETGSLTERIAKLCRPLSTWSPPPEACIRPNESFGAKPLLKVTSFVSTGLEHKI
ncbi:sodium- and chloride-dependent glycine transporter 2 [Hyalella azteca]|uniref:Transporter n=1 Tax=Hyalella azteca TaxID=294128 RepID=A0A8B7PLK8_HYAAZ|nr:sodium- and chloride-dependent glycine transporter 2 [Hyalella azteca]